MARTKKSDLKKKTEKKLKKTGTIKKKNINVTVLSATNKLKSQQHKNAEYWWREQLFGRRLKRSVKLHLSKKLKPNAVFTGHATRLVEL